MPQITVSRPPGRPKDETKRAAIVEAARLLFRGGAYEAVTMEQVAAAAGVAKMTVYSHFHDKESLFEATVRATSDMLVAALPALPGRRGDLEEELVAFGQAFLHVLFDPGLVGSLHSHFEMLSRNRALAERFYNSGPGRTRGVLAAHLRSAAGWVDRSPEWSIRAASDLMNLWIGDRPQRIAMGLAEPITSDQIAAEVRRCTRLFMRGYGLSLAERPEGAARLAAL